MADQDVIPLYLTCDDVPSGCTADCSSPYSNGGTPHGGNQTQAISWSGVDVTIKADTRPCIDSLKKSVAHFANVVSTFQTIFSPETNFSSVADMIRRLATTSGWDVKIGERAIPDVVDSTTGEVKHTMASTTGVGGSVVIDFNTNYLNTATELSVMRTMTHELMHAYFTYGIHKTDDPGYSDFVTANKLLFNEDGSAGDQPIVQHELMATKYVDEMALILTKLCHG